MLTATECECSGCGCLMRVSSFQACPTCVFAVPRNLERRPIRGFARGWVETLRDASGYVVNPDGSLNL